MSKPTSKYYIKMNDDECSGVYKVDSPQDQRGSRGKNCDSRNVRWMCYTLGFLLGMDKSITIPIMWLYLLNIWNKEVAQEYYGICTSGYNISLVVGTILVTILSQIDLKFITTKNMIILFDLLAVIGNAIFAAGIFPYLLVIGRLITGISGSGAIPLTADTIKTTRRDERSTVFAYMNGLSVLGMVVGPSVDFLAALLWKLPAVANSGVSVYKAPGMIMALLHLVHLIFLLIFYPAELKYTREDDVNEDENLTIRQKLLHPELPKLKCISLVLAESSAYFMFVALETSIGPIVEQHFQWTNLNTSTLFVFYGIACVISYILIGCLFKCFTDFSLLFSGCFLKFCATSMCLATLLTLKDSLSSRIMLIISLILQIPGDSLLLAPSDGIYSKIVPLKIAFLAQGVLRISTSISGSLGTLFAGSISSGSYFWMVAVATFSTTILVSLVLLVVFSEKISCLPVCCRKNPLSL